LLERVPDALVGGAPRAADLDDPQPRPGRFGWQSATATIAEQTAVAMSREIGLTSTPVDHDDCTPAQAACRAAPSGGAPEVSPEFLAALVEFQQDLAVPRARSAAPDASALFAETGCTACHRPTLPVEGVPGLASITAYTDLRVHDLGAALADRDASGRVVPTRFRTAPLWGLDHAARRPLALLHDGRARSIEEAILWHDGEAHAVRERFERLDAGARRRLTDWLGAL
ncbi:MAG TPA: di-heme oxidoredictase family protein, partial [Dokdonella sp.]